MESGGGGGGWGQNFREQSLVGIITGVLQYEGAHRKVLFLVRTAVRNMAAELETKAPRGTLIGNVAGECALCLGSREA